MTSEHPMSSAHSGRDRHLTPIVLAEHAEGLLPPHQASGVDDHLRACAACRNVSDALAAVSVRLAEAPRELPVPSAVADRIATALADERADRTAAHAPAASLNRWTSRLRRRAPALLAAAATVGAIGLAAYAINSDIFSGRPTDDSTAGSSADNDAGDTAPEAAQDSAGDEAAPLDQDAGSGADADDGPAEDARDDAAGDSLEEQDGALTLNDPELTDEIQAVASGRASGPSPAFASDGCGANLAEELGREVVGAAATDLVEPDSVLVVVTTDDPDSVEGWVLPTCDDGPDDALASQDAPRR